VPNQIRTDFARVSLTAALAWASVALYLSIVPSYAGKLLTTHDLALLGAIAAVALASSGAAQIVSHRVRLRLRQGEGAGLGVIALGLLILALASPEHSLALLLAGAVATGAGHGFAFLNAQDELNAIAPPERRGEVTAAFICCIYAVVAGAVIATGLLDLGVSLAAAVGAVVVALAGAALAIAGWQARGA